ncbi:hypothetical protein [Polaribacter sp. HaHaR_3_91]|nr:hypothetical protein [Polaribacter sp. HaHaR_3_91]
MNVKSEYIGYAFSVSISTMFSNPMNEKGKVHVTFMRVKGI